MFRSESPTLAVSRCLGIAFLAALLAIVLGIVAAGDTVLPGDLVVTRAIQRALPEPIETLAHVGHHIGSTLWGSILLGSAILVALLQRAIPESVFLMIAAALRLLTGLLKPLFASPRPTDDLVTVIGAYDGTGYPSGHAQTGAVIGLAFAVLAWRGIPDRRLAIVTAGFTMLTGLMIGWSRIALGAHWPSDVLGGFLVGTAIVAIAAAALQWIELREATSPTGGIRRGTTA